MNRKDIHTIAQNSNASYKVIGNALKVFVYNDKANWQKFIQILLLSIGIGFTISGIIFFFAYNWEHLHKFLKLGLVEGILLVATVPLFIPKIKNYIKSIILTGSSFLVGLLFAVFGQVYQTGANSYDFFLAWTIFISLWVWISNFYPLWLLYIVLINTTLHFYSEQVANNWSEVLVYTIHFVTIAAALISSILIAKTKVPKWFINTLAISSISYSTAGISIGIFNNFSFDFGILILISGIVYALGIWYGLRTKNSVFVSIIPLSLIIIISAFLVDVSENEAMFFIISLFIIISISYTIKKLIELHKKWKNEL